MEENYKDNFLSGVEYQVVEGSKVSLNSVHRVQAGEGCLRQVTQIQGTFSTPPSLQHLSRKIKLAISLRCCLMERMVSPLVEVKRKKCKKEDDNS